MCKHNDGYVTNEHKDNIAAVSKQIRITKRQSLDGVCGINGTGRRSTFTELLLFVGKKLATLAMTNSIAKRPLHPLGGVMW